MVVLTGSGLVLPNAFPWADGTGSYDLVLDLTDAQGNSINASSLQLSPAIESAIIPLVIACYEGYAQRLSSENRLSSGSLLDLCTRITLVKEPNGSGCQVCEEGGPSVDASQISLQTDRINDLRTRHVEWQGRNVKDAMVLMEGMLQGRSVEWQLANSPSISNSQPPRTSPPIVNQPPLTTTSVPPSAPEQSSIHHADSLAMDGNNSSNQTTTSIPASVPTSLGESSNPQPTSQTSVPTSSAHPTDPLTVETTSSSHQTTIPTYTQASPLDNTRPLPPSLQQSALPDDQLDPVKRGLRDDYFRFLQTPFRLNGIDREITFQDVFEPSRDEDGIAIGACLHQALENVQDQRTLDRNQEILWRKVQEYFHHRLRGIVTPWSEACLREHDQYQRIYTAHAQVLGSQLYVGFASFVQHQLGVGLFRNFLTRHQINDRNFHDFNAFNPLQLSPVAASLWNASSL